MAQVSRRFRVLADNPQLWRRLYKEVFEYDNVLIHPEKCVFEFVTPDYRDHVNPWKECFREFYHGVHVRPGYKEFNRGGRKIKNFQTIRHALEFVSQYTDKQTVIGGHALIFIHTGTYYEGIIIDSNVALLGAASGNVMKSVILESRCINTIQIEMGATAAYIGYLTIKYSPEEVSYMQFANYCLQITEYCSPTVAKCIIHSTSLYESAVRVSGRNANPTIQFCRISECKCRGICVENYAEGIYENNKIDRNRLTGIWVRNGANPVFQQNTVYGGQEVGIKVSGKAMGCFQANEVFNNRDAAFEVSDLGRPVVMDNHLESGVAGSVYIHHGGSGVFVNNKICSRDSYGVRIIGCDPTFRKNNIHNCKEGVYIAANGRSMIEENVIVSCTSSGIHIVNSDPIIRNNKIHQCHQIGIHVSDESKGCIHDNEIYSNKFEGLLIETGSATSILRNRIYLGRIGVHFQNGGGGDLAYNVIFNNQYTNIKITTESNPSVRKNKIRCGESGVLISNEGLGVLEENEISENEVANVWIKNFSDPTLKRNKIFDSRGFGVYVFYNSRGLLEENLIFGNLDSAVYICLQSDPTLRENRIFYGLGAGVEINYNATATLEYNQIFNNEFAGLSLAKGICPTLKENLICNNSQTVGKALADRKCLYSIFNDRKVLHDLYRCRTCMKVDYNQVCESCAKNCHSVHEVSYVRKDKFFCSCGIGELDAQCSLLGEPPQTKTPSPREATPADYSPTLSSSLVCTSLN